MQCKAGLKLDVSTSGERIVHPLPASQRGGRCSAVALGSPSAAADPLLDMQSPDCVDRVAIDPRTESSCAELLCLCVDLPVCAAVMRYGKRRHEASSATFCLFVCFCSKPSPGIMLEPDEPGTSGAAGHKLVIKISPWCVL